MGFPWPLCCCRARHVVVMAPMLFPCSIFLVCCQVVAVTAMQPMLLSWPPYWCHIYTKLLTWPPCCCQDHHVVDMVEMVLLLPPCCCHDRHVFAMTEMLLLWRLYSSYDGHVVSVTAKWLPWSSCCFLCVGAGKQPVPLLLMDRASDGCEIRWQEPLSCLRTGSSAAVRGKQRKWLSV